MSSKDTEILVFNEYQISDKIPPIIYADFESFIKTWDKSKNDIENSFTTKVGEHSSCGYSMSTVWAFDGIENNHYIQRWGLHE